MSLQRSLAAAAILLIALTLAAPAPAAEAEPGPALLLILDASGSMWGQIQGENKIVIARRVLGELVDGLEEGADVGVVAYGHRREGDCDDIETVVPIGPLDKAAVKATVDGLNPKGKTPLTRSVQQAFDGLKGRPGGASIILVSDGLDTCGGDPCGAVRAAKQMGLDFRLHVVGFDVAGEDVSQLECAAQAGDGLFLSAENADELAVALDTAVAMAPEVPPGRLSLKAVADGELQDAAVFVTDAETSADLAGGRTYTSPDTNPRLIPLPDGKFNVRVQAVGFRGDISRTFAIEIVDGGLVEKVADFSTGELTIGVTRNGELSDAVYNVRLPGGGAEVASGRTYTGEKSNPARERITSGTYEVGVGSVEISGRPWAQLGTVTIEPGGSVAVSHAWESGTLSVGAARDGALVDTTLNVVNIETGESVAQGRTYTSDSSNPKTFLLLPGAYRVTVNEIRGEKRTIEVSLAAGETVERMVDPAAGG
jgi:Ca-activated chloride channel family protein